jgi:signal transduction histidine kinase/DNA-binding response OmpR family regulator
MIALSINFPIPILIGTYVYSTFESKQEEFVIVSTKKFELSSEIFSESLWNFYPELGETMIHQLNLDKNFVSLSVRDADGKLFLSQKNQTVTDIDNLLVLEKVLVRNGINIGTLDMEFKKEGLMESVKSDMVLFGSIALLQVLLIIVVVAFIYYYKIIKPMKRLVIDSKKLANKNLDEPFIWDGKDEINSLGRALDKTRISLKNAFAALIEQNETLDEKVKQRTQELEETSRYKSEFLANMSHEIRTPMNAIVGMCHLISKTVLNDAQSNYVIKIKDASSVLLRIINDILDFSKIEAGKLSIETIAFDMHKEMKKSISIFSILAKDKGLELDSDFVNTHRFYKGDPYRIVQILNNFLSNAIKFTSQGNILLSVTQEPINEKKNKLIFSVTDSGEGISEEKKSKLFTAFGQLDASTTRKHGGTGLGLYICTQLADMMGGKITFDTLEGVGSTFNLELELEKVEGIDVQKENGLDLFVPLHILLIEDDRNSRNILREYVRSFGFFITVVGSYEKALKKIERGTEKYDLFIIDYHLPNVDGIQTYELLKQKMINPPPAIMITVDDNSDIKSKALGSGFERFLVKPINPSFIYDDITALCNIEKSEPYLQHTKLDFSDKTILLVEDNEINLEVALYLLKETDANVDIARNGFEAVEKVKEKAYDAILMDLQMPVMDGYEATKIIRKELGYTKYIVAMTANVMANDVKRCLESGMNEHIGKPLEIEDFYGTLLKIFDKKNLKIPSAHSKQKDVVFDKEGAINRLANNIALWEKAFCKFYEKYKNLVQEIDALRSSQDTQALQLYIHTLKGLCGTVGANKLQSESLKIDVQLKEKRDLQSICFENLIKEYEKFYTSITDEYENRCVKIPKMATEEVTQEQILEVLNNLEIALDISNVAEVKKSIQSLLCCSFFTKSELLNSLISSCETFDFEMALDYTKKLKEELKSV